MSIVDIVFIIIALVCCSAGSAWLLWDMRQQFKEYNKFMHKEQEEKDE